MFLLLLNISLAWKISKTRVVRKSNNRELIVTSEFETEIAARGFNYSVCGDYNKTDLVRYKKIKIAN